MFNDNELVYLRTLEKILTTGEERNDRTGVGTISLPTQTMSFDIGFSPMILTTKQMFLNQMINELLFMLSGKTDTRILEQKGNKWWQGNTRKSELLKHNLPFEEGDMGPIYGFQWRHYGAEYTGMESDYTNKGFDQIKDLIQQLRTNPWGRRHIITTWNPTANKSAPLPPCHGIVTQFYVSNKYELDCTMYQRSGDMFLGVPYNIAFYSTLTYMIAKVCSMKPRNLTLIIGDAHIYKNHIDQVKLQLSRQPFFNPMLSFNFEHDKIDEIDDFKLEHFKWSNYTYHPKIATEMAV